MSLRRPLQLSLGITVSAAFLWLVLRVMPLTDVAQALRHADPGWIAIAIGCFVLGYVCRIWRWQRMLCPLNPSLTWRQAAVPFMVSIAANNVMPFRAGDALRTLGFTRWLGVPTASVLATLLAERMMDLLALLLALGLGVWLYQSEAQALNALLGISGALLFGLATLIAALLLFPQLIRRPLTGLLKLIGRVSPGLADKIGIQGNHLFRTLGTIAQRPRMAQLMGISVLAWAFEACVFYAIARAIPDLGAPFAAWLAMPVGTLSTLLPSTPGYVGTFHYFVMTVAQIAGNTAVAAGAFAILVHLALWIPATLWGAGSFLYWVLVRPSQSPSSNKAA